jgi:hypothetical protein
MPRRDEAERRTAHKYSNVSNRERLRETSIDRQPAPTTLSDLPAESSHRGDHPTIFTCGTGGVFVRLCSMRGPFLIEFLSFCNSQAQALTASGALCLRLARA